jgi:CPA1 family monovalent cation:H+ antiporter
MGIVELVIIIAALFILVGLSEPLAERLRLPYSVALALIGGLLGAAAAFVPDATGGAGGLAALSGLRELPITSNVFLYILLPILLFQVALGLNLRRMLDDWVPILVLAIVAVVVATMVIGLALWPLAGLPLVACLLIGAIVSTTDPSAVVSIFRNIGAPARLARIVEGESLLNDAVAIALFGFFLTFVRQDVPNPTLADALILFPWVIVSGVLAGWAVFRAGMALLALLPRHPVAQVTLSVALPFLTFILTDRVLGGSGVVAVVTAGLMFNLAGPARLSPGAFAYMREVWDLIAHWAGSFIFVLAALLIPRLAADVRPTDLALVGAVVVAATFARAIVLSGMLPALAFLRLSPRVERPYRIAILWGGLRGAVTLALALVVTENAHIAPEVKRMVGIVATGFTLFTIFVQGTTLRWMIGALGLDRLAPIDQALSDQVIAVALQNVREEVSETVRRHELTPETIRAEEAMFDTRLEAALARAEGATEILDRDRITLGLVALAGRERDLLLESFRQDLVSDGLMAQMLPDAERLIERTRQGGRLEYRNAARAATGYGRWHRFAHLLHHRFGMSRLLARLMADRFERLIAQTQILRELHGFIDGKIRPIHGARVAELLHELLNRRAEEIKTALEGLRLQYPGYAEKLERRFIRRIAQRYEARQYDLLRDDGLIGPELHTALRNTSDHVLRHADERPRLDIAVQRSEIIRQLPAFADLDETQRRKLARALDTIYVEPGDIVMRRGDSARRVFFIASGAVELDFGAERLKLGRGEMFGWISVVARTPRRSQVTAITHGTLLALDQARFTAMLGKNPALLAEIRKSAERRGVTIDLPGDPSEASMRGPDRGDPASPG